MIEAQREQALMLEAARDILEMMFFASPESSEIPEPWPGEMLTAAIRGRSRGRFSDPYRGRLRACAGWKLLRSLRSG